MSGRAPWFLFCLIALFVAPGAGAVPWLAQPPLHLYEARVLVTGTDLRSRPAGLSQCLRDALVQVSGNPALAADPRVPVLAPQAENLLADYHYVDRMSGIAHHDEQGSSDRPYWLTARFDPTRLDALLARLDERPWAEPRPTLVPVVRVTRPAGARHLLAKSAPEDAPMLDALAEAAQRYGLPLALSERHELIADALHAAPGAQRAPPDAPSDFQNGRLYASGSLVWSEVAHGWVGSFGVGQRRWGVRGVSFDEAFRVLVRGAAALASGHAAFLGAATASTP